MNRSIKNNFLTQTFFILFALTAVIPLFYTSVMAEKTCDLCNNPELNNLECPFCNYKATKNRLSNFLRHVFTHSYNQKLSKNPKFLHIKNVHIISKEANYHCPFCSQKYTFKDILRVHLNREHAKKSRLAREDAARNAKKIKETKQTSKLSTPKTTTFKKHNIKIKTKRIIQHRPNTTNINNSPTQPEIVPESIAQQDNFLIPEEQHPYLINSDFFENFEEEQENNKNIENEINIANNIYFSYPRQQPVSNINTNRFFK